MRGSPAVALVLCVGCSGAVSLRHVQVEQDGGWSRFVAEWRRAQAEDALEAFNIAYLREMLLGLSQVEIIGGLGMPMPGQLRTLGVSRAGPMTDEERLAVEEHNRDVQDMISHPNPMRYELAILRILYIRLDEPRGRATDVWIGP